jgi:putative transposase
MWIDDLSVYDKKTGIDWKWQAMDGVITKAWPEPTTRSKQHMCMDKGYDYSEVYELLEYYGYTIHIRLRGEHRVNCKRIPRYRARHWIVERTHSWMNRFRRLLIRWEKKLENYVAMLHFACTCITYRAAGLFG